MMKEFFERDKILYKGSASTDPFSFKYYNKDEVLGGKTMGEHLKFAMSWWHTLCAEGTDMFGAGTGDKSFGGADPMQTAENRVYAGFELMQKLGIDYFCFHDKDIAPEGDSLRAFRDNLGHIVPIIREQMDKTGIRCLWGTANLFNHPRYAHGAGTSPYADVFACAAAQIKNALDCTIALQGSGYVFWGGREGYDTLLNTDMALEQDNMAHLMKLAVDYGRRNGFMGDFYIEPKPKEPTKHQYDYDAATVLAFLRKYGLEKDFKLNIEANHATLAGHTFRHELATARINGAFGSIDANQGDLLLGWDTDEFPWNVYETTFCMWEVLRAGGFTNGGLNFDAKTRRASFTADDIFLAYITGMDAFALGLKKAYALMEDGRIDAFLKERYASYNTGIGQKIQNGTVTLEELADYALNDTHGPKPVSGSQEYLQSIVNSVLFQ